jgi:hypothetical protein
LSHSARYSEVNYGYFKPDEINIDRANWNFIVENMSKDAIKRFMKQNGVKRREIYDRGSDSLKIRPFSIGFDVEDEYSWKHFFNQRGIDPHTQLETRDFVNELNKKVVEE